LLTALSFLLLTVTIFAAMDQLLLNSLLLFLMLRLLGLLGFRRLGHRGGGI